MIVRVLQVMLVLKVRLVIKDTLDLRENQVHLVKLVRLDHRDPKELLETLDPG